MKFEKYQMPADSVQPELANTKEGWLDPIVVGPSTSHARSIIILHGRGDNAYNFGAMLLDLPLPKSTMTLPQIFSDTKFILPTSRLRRSWVHERNRITQWFDIFSILAPDERQELQYEGIEDSSRFIHHIIRQEAELVGLDNVIIGGLSQGCATGLHVLMSFEGDGGQRLGGFFGMSGWLPFAKQLNLISEGKGSFSTDGEVEGALEAGNKEDEDPFSDPRGKKEEDASLGARAIKFVREHVMDFSDTKASNASVSVPVFLGHGESDEKVLPGLGRNAANIMAKLGWNVTWKSYNDLGHWYSLEELDDIADFICGTCPSTKV